MSIRQAGNEAKYDAAASIYGVVAFIMSLGQNRRIYRAVAEAMRMTNGETVAEFGCGPGVVIPYLREQCGESGTIVGIDFSERMIAVANRRKRDGKWDNVEFRCMDMYDYPDEDKADVVIFCLALTAIPDCLKALRKAVSVLNPGGRLIIADSFPLHDRWWRVFTNAYISLKSLVVGAKPTDKVLPYIESTMRDVRIASMVGGVYTLVSARKPA